MSFGHFAKKLATVLSKGEFIPSRHGTLAYGYDLWATHPNGDVIVHCGGNAGWFDWFRPVQPGDDPDFELTIAGRQYRLVRGVDDIPSGFVRKGDAPAAHPGQVRRPGLPTAKRGPTGPQVITRAVVAHSPWERPYNIEYLSEGRWVDSKWAHRTLDQAKAMGERYYQHQGVGFCVVYRTTIAYEWRPAPPEGASA